MAYIFTIICVSNLVSNLCKNSLCINQHQKSTVISVKKHGRKSSNLNLNQNIINKLSHLDTGFHHNLDFKFWSYYFLFFHCYISVFQRHNHISHGAVEDAEVWNWIILFGIRFHCKYCSVVSRVASRILITSSKAFFGPSCFDRVLVFPLVKKTLPRAQKTNNSARFI